MLLIDPRWWTEDYAVAREHFNNVHRAAQVSKLWDQVIRASPAIWALNHSTFSLLLNAQAFAKSEHELLTVSWNSSQYPFQSFAEFAKPHVHRFRFLRLHLPHWEDFQMFLGDQPGPKLEALQLTLARYPFGQPPPLDPFQGDTPSLKEVKLNGVPIVWDSGMLKGLHTLELRRLDGFGPPPDKLLSILASNPNLTSLALNLINSHPKPVFKDATIVTLPRLKYIQLSWLSDDLAHFILRHIRAPNCREFHLIRDPQAGAGPFTSLSDAFRGFLSTVQSHVKKAYVEVEGDDANCRLVGGDGDRDRSYVIGLQPRDDPRRAPDLGAALVWIADLLQAAFPSLKVIFIFSCMDFRSLTLRPGLWKLQGLEEIQVRSSCRGSIQLFDLLSSSSIVDGVRQ